MTAVKVRGVTIGEGIPKICVPIIASAKEDIIAQARIFCRHSVDMVEWRVDYFECAMDTEKVLETASDLRKTIGDMPILFTFRTTKEGGEKEILPDHYEEINLAAAKSGYVDLVDVEAFADGEIAEKMISKIHAAGVKVVVSNHDFNKTPEKSEIVRRLCVMQDMGADIAKIAVMPQSRRDVLTLLDATLEVHERSVRCPIVTMSMGELGKVSRIAGNTFGSAITFGAGEKASAPGQIAIETLADIVQLGT